MAKVLLIEPFCVGSHKQLIDLLQSAIPECETYTLPGKKWHWKARTSALWLSQKIPKNHSYRTLFASSVLNLAELIALRPDLASLHKVFYFHENQLAYPVRNEKERDFQYGYNQIISSMVADVNLFNSKFNMDSFLEKIKSFLKTIPDHRPKGISELLKPKCVVLNFPILFPSSKRLTKIKPDSSLCLKNVHGQFNLEVKSEVNETCCVTKDDATLPLQSCHSNSNNSSVESMVLNQSSGRTMENSNVFLVTQKSVKLESTSMAVTDNMVKTEESDCHLDSDKPNLMQTTELVKSMEGNADKDISEPVQSELECVKNTQEPVCTDFGNIRKPVYRTVPLKRTLDSWESSQPSKRRRLTPKEGPLHIVWPHRWEHDKDPDLFFRVILKLHENGVDFRLSVLGETFHDVPAVFEESRLVLGDRIINWGYQPSKEIYYDILWSADCVVSTAKHEFFGVAMLEAVRLGCHPVCPNQLVYPEIFPKKCLYNTEAQLYKMLREMCRKPYEVRNKQFMVHFLVDTNQYSWETLKPEFLKHLNLHEYL